MGTSNAGFKHASAPHRNIVRCADIVDSLGLGKAADSAGFDVDNAAGANLNGLRGIASVMDGFVETNGGSQQRLQAGVIVNVVVPERLLDHQEIELIELSQMLDLIQRVSGIGVATQDDFRPAGTNTFEYIDVPARFHFDFNAQITGCQ